MATLIDKELDSLCGSFLYPGSSVETNGISELIRTARSDTRRDETIPHLESRVQVLLCPGPYFAGVTAARFVHSTTILCPPRQYIIVDLSEVADVDATGLLALSTLVRRCRDAGGAPRLCSPNQAVRQLLAAAGVHHRVDVYHTRRHASAV